MSNNLNISHVHDKSTDCINSNERIQIVNKLQSNQQQNLLLQKPKDKKRGGANISNNKYDGEESGSDIAGLNIDEKLNTYEKEKQPYYKYANKQ